MEQFIIPQGKFKLLRYPSRKKESLRAWDAADEYILNYIHEQHLDKTPVLIINDSFGGLSVALADKNPVMWTDSFLAQQGTKNNLVNNSLSSKQVKLCNSMETPDGVFGLVIIKIPKGLAQLEDQLHRLKPHINNETTVIGAGMVKSIHTSTLDLFSSIIGETRTSKAKKKSRLIFSIPDMDIPASASPYPGEYKLENTPYLIRNHASIFSLDSLDIGTRFFIEHIPSSDKTKQVTDLGCGNGIIGIIAAERNPQATITFTDESYMAVASAEYNFKNAFSGKRNAQYLVGDCLQTIQKESMDLVLINPPFHQHNAVGDSTAWQMFSESRDALKQGGEIWVIGNRHLDYHVKLKRLFGNYVNIASNKKFVILKAIKR
ncbi:MAG: methyltransferase [Gammaproteobacteria bacterium]|nr:methyltransferase [Gammaproteobacteria bacterium]